MPLSNSAIALGGGVCEGMQLLVKYWRSVVREASGNRVTRQDGYCMSLTQLPGHLEWDHPMLTSVATAVGGRF